MKNGNKTNEGRSMLHVALHEIPVDYIPRVAMEIVAIESEVQFGYMYDLPLFT